MGCFFALQRAVAPCLNGYLFPTALFASRLNCRSRGGVEICLVSKRMFIPDGTPVLVTEYYILTQRKPEALNMVACSATSVESCLCLKARKVWQRGRLRRWGRRRSDAELQRFKTYLKLMSEQIFKPLILQMYFSASSKISATCCFRFGMVSRLGLKVKLYSSRWIMA